MYRSSAASLLSGILLLASAPATAQSRDCAFTREVTARVELPSGTRLHVNAEAGALVVRGVDGLREARVRGTVCASTAALAQEASVRTAREAGAVVVETMIPDTDWRMMHDVHVRIDLLVEVPARTPATVHDGSGSAELSGLGDLEVHDGSGDLQIADIYGSLDVDDGSGDLEIQRASGAVQVNDGSGDVTIRDAGGTVRIRDGSGSIDVDGVRGDFVVLEDGSGSIRHANVSGRVDVPQRGRRHYR